MRMFYHSHKDTIERVAFFMIIVLMVYALFKYLFAYVAPFFFGLLISLLMEPLISLLVKRARFSRTLASALCLLLFLVAVGSLGTLIVSNLSKQIRSFMDAAPALIDDFSRRMENANDWLASWVDRMPETIFPEYPDIRDTLVTGLSALFGAGVKDQSLRIVSNVPDFFIGLILSVVSAFFFMKDKKLIFGTLAQLCPEWLIRQLRPMGTGLSRAAAGYFKAEFILMAIAGIISIGGLLVLRNPYALLIGLIIAVLDFLPIFGSGTVLIPWALFSLLTGQYQMAIGLLILYGVITITRQVLEPKILGEQIGIHPLVTLMSVYIGFKIFGFFGIVIGPSLVIIFKAVRLAEREV